MQFWQGYLLTEWAGEIPPIRGEEMKNATCKGCERRHKLCWKDCEDYKRFREQMDEIREARQKRNELAEAIADVRRKR